jgi:hypothetical protein
MLEHWPPKFDGIIFLTLGLIQGHKAHHLLITWGKLKSYFLPILTLTPDVKPLGLISTFAPVRMLDLG